MLSSDLEPEMGEWSQLEYAIIGSECSTSGSQFYLTSVPASLVDNFPPALKVYTDSGRLIVTPTEVSQLPGIQSDRVCLLDPAAKVELAPEDGEKFDWYVFGGILGRSLISNTRGAAAYQYRFELEADAVHGRRRSTKR